jgi:hypothetical protein
MGNFKKVSRFLVLLFIAARMLVYLSSTWEGLKGYGDFFHFYQLALLPGLPYIHYWIEFPPVFSFLSEFLLIIAGGQEHVFDYLLAIILLIADAGSLWLFIRLNERLYTNLQPGRNLVYLGILVSLAYYWWYFDSLAVFLMMIALFFMFERKTILVGVVLGIGILTKLFPFLAIVALWKSGSWRRMIITTSIAVSIAIVVYGILWLISPQFTLASIKSQPSKGSWETVWALIDGNYKTGNFGPILEKYDPNQASILRGNPAKISTWLTLFLFGSIGLYGLTRIREISVMTRLSMVGWAWCIFLLWSPGYSPQWLLYLIPLILLVLPELRAYLFTLVLILVNLLEWPLMMSRGYFEGLNITIPLRTLIIILLAVVFYQQMTTTHTRLDGNLKAQESLYELQ